MKYTILYTGNKQRGLALSAMQHSSSFLIKLNETATDRIWRANWLRRNGAN